MPAAPLHPQESDRLDSLQALRILDTVPEKEFDEITAVAAQICGTPVSLVSLVDKNRQWFKAKTGLRLDETPRDWSFCAHAILQKDIFVVPDSLADDRFQDNPLSRGEPPVRFYAGVPLRGPGEFPLGTLCVIDHCPRELRTEQLEALCSLARQVEKLFELRWRLRQLEAINEKLKFHRTAIENLCEGVVLQDAECRVLEFNQAALDLLGIKEDKMLGRTPFRGDLAYVDDQGQPLPPEKHPSVRALREGRQQRDLVMGVPQAKGPSRWLLVTATPIFAEENGKATHCVTSFVDVTTQKRSREIIEKKEADLKRILDGVPAMIGHWDVNLRNLSANEAYRECFGKGPQEIRGRHIEEILGKELYQRNLPAMRAALNGKTQSFERDIRFRDGSLHQVLVTYLPDFEGNQIRGFFVVVADVTEMKTLERQRREMEMKLMEAARLSTLGEMAGGIAHEINNPLTIIKGKTLEIRRKIERGAGVEECLQGLGKIEGTVDRISKIIKGLRAFSRDAEEDPFETLQFSAVLEDTLGLCGERFRNAETTLLIRPYEDFKFAGRAPQISQVLMNLLENAYDAVQKQAEKWVEIRVETTADRGCIRIIDSGNGVPQHIVPKLMEPFFTTKEVGKGTGLGLSISRGIVDAHGGRLFYEAGGKHTCFVIELPLKGPAN